ncbi:MAG: sigma-70 family RNA polymerase sigma factor [Deltaproteobacteria bacterium]|nr:sigma-70 family RNA polymerase sigma factor [Deltaproteobacteria bacterium]
MKRRSTPSPSSPSRRLSGPRDAESCLVAELGDQALLDRDAEAALATEIAAARRRLRTLLRGAPRLVALALADAGRGVIEPTRDFREREALAVLRTAEAARGTRGGWRATGLGAAQLRRLIGDLDAALRDYRALRDRMLRANVRLVAALARRHRHPTLSFLDLFQEGTFGLLRAVEKYEPSRGVRFGTYAAWWISQQLARAADMHGSVIRTPVHWNQMRRRLGREAGSGSFSDRRARAASAVGIEEQRFATMTEAWQFISTDAAAADDSRAFAALLADDRADPLATIAQRGLHDQLESLVAQLPPREQLIMRRRYGLGGEQPQTLHELAAEMGISRERIRQLEARGLARLRATCSARGLQDYLH